MGPAMSQLRQNLSNKRHHVSHNWHVRCVRHVMNRAVKDAEDIFASQVMKLRELLKLIRSTSEFRDQFKPLQIALGVKEKDPTVFQL